MTINKLFRFFYITGIFIIITSLLFSCQGNPGTGQAKSSGVSLISKESSGGNVSTEISGSGSYFDESKISQIFSKSGSSNVSRIPASSAPGSSNSKISSSFHSGINSIEEKPVIPDMDISLITPVNGAEVFIPFPNFTWSCDAGADAAYNIQIARDAQFSDIIDEDTVYSKRYVPANPLPAARIYWRVSFKLNPRKFSSSFNVVKADKTVNVAYDPSSANHLAAVDAAISQAISFNNAGYNVTVNFPKGKYRCEGGVRDYFMRISGADGLIINGNGSSIEFSKYFMTAASITNSKNVLVQGFVIDNPEHVPFVQGKVVSVDPTVGQITVSTDGNASSYDDGFIKIDSEFMVLLDPAINGKLKDNVPNNYFFSKIVKTGSYHTLTLKNKTDAKYFASGDRFAHLGRNGGAQPLLFSQDSVNVTYNEITSYVSSGAFIVSFNGSILNVINVHGKIASGRWFGLNADGIHARSMAIGPWIENSSLEGLGDDAVALYSRPSTINAKFPGGNRKALIVDPLYFNMQSGDEVSFFNPARGYIYMETTIKSVQSKDGKWLVVFSDDLPMDINEGANILDNDQIWNRSKSCGDFVIRNSTITNIRRYGTVFRAKGGVVENNIYKGTSAAAVIFINEPIYPNGLYCSEIVIRGNKISNCAFDSMPTSALSILFKNRAGGAAESFGPKNIIIENNDITGSNSRRAAISLLSAEKLKFRSNTISGAPLNENYNLHITADHVREIDYGK